jgi:hypothetical protein
MSTPRSFGRLPHRPDLGDCPSHEFIHGATNLMVGQCDTLGVEVTPNLSKHVMVAGVLDIRDDDGSGIGLGFSTGETEPGRRPKAEKTIAARRRLEFYLVWSRN